MLNLQTSGIYHTDFPEYVRILTEDSFLESLAWSYMHWLYGQVDTVFVNSEQYRKCWIDRGFAPEKLKILPRGLDTDLFNPQRRDLSFWKRFGANGKDVRLLYVGRISREKDLDVLAAAYHKVREAGEPVKLYLVGHGPYSEALAAALPDAVFLGYLTGEPLAKAYASADIFVFPSTTDTFGNVVIEAQASGSSGDRLRSGRAEGAGGGRGQRAGHKSARHGRRGARDHASGQRSEIASANGSKRRARAWWIGAGRTPFASSGIRPIYKFHTIHYGNLHYRNNLRSI